MAPRYISTPLGPNDDGRRIDRVARKVFSQLPLSRIYSAIRSGDIRLNGKRVKGETRVAAGDSLDVRHWLVAGITLSRPSARSEPRPEELQRGRTGPGPAAGSRARPAAGTSPSDSAERSPHLFASRIVFESPHVLVVSKLRGELVHGENSLETRVQDHLAGRVESGVSFRPGPVHRLDRNTTGIVVYSASLRGAQEMSKALRGHWIRKLYVAVLSGVVSGEQRWDSAIARDVGTHRSQALAEPLDSQGTQSDPQSDPRSAGQEALTLVTPVHSSDKATLVVAQIVTGRTHQIRAHAAANGTPLLGDRKYGGPPLPGGYILHAGALATTKTIPEIDFSHLWTPLPTYAEERVRKLFGDTALASLYDKLSVPGR